jgi:hypothetical protein
MKRATFVICLAAILLLALAVPAFAEPDGTSGTVYGKAVLAPYAITITGAGTDPGSPLTYQGELGSWAWERYGSQVTVTNVGTMNARINLDVDTLPTDGATTWNLTSSPGPNSAAWWLVDESVSADAEVLPANDDHYAGNGHFYDALASGHSYVLDSAFQFPTSTSSMADHYMSATISAVAP